MKRFFREKKGNNSAFTVIEMLVVIGITAVIAGMLLGFNRSSEKTIALATERERVMSLLGRARSLALQRKNPGSGFACGYGVSFSGSSVALFGIYRGDSSIVTDCIALEASKTDSTIETFALEKGATTTGVTRIYFSAPYLNTTFFTPSPGTFPAIISISIPGIGSSKIEITAGGSISQKNL